MESTEHVTVLRLHDEKVGMALRMEAARRYMPPSRLAVELLGKLLLTNTEQVDKKVK